MRRLSAMIGSMLLVMAVAGPAAAAAPTRTLVPLDPFTSICYDTSLQTWVTLDGTITFGKVTQTTFYDRNGNVTRDVFTGPEIVQITDPATGITVSKINTSAAVTADYVSGDLLVSGPALFANTVVTLGHWDFATGTFRGTTKDFCPAFGYLSYDPNEV